MTVTASATDRELLGHAEGSSYGALSEREAGYVIRPRPAFDLEPRRTGKQWTVVDRQTGIHGVGETPTDALADFRRAAVEHLDVLERQEALSEDLVAQRDYLRLRLNA
jgi:hypothetical protein